MVFSRRGSQVIVTAWLAAIVAAGIAAGIGFRIDNSVSVWFGAEDPALATWRKTVEQFGGRLAVELRADAAICLRPRSA